MFYNRLPLAQSQSITVSDGWQLLGDGATLDLGSSNIRVSGSGTFRGYRSFPKIASITFRNGGSQAITSYGTVRLENVRSLFHFYSSHIALACYASCTFLGLTLTVPLPNDHCQLRPADRMLKPQLFVFSVCSPSPPLLLSSEFLSLCENTNLQSL